METGDEHPFRLPNCILDRQARAHDSVLLGMELVAPFENPSAGD